MTIRHFEFKNLKNSLTGDRFIIIVQPFDIKLISLGLEQKSGYSCAVFVDMR